MTNSVVSAAPLTDHGEQLYLPVAITLFMEGDSCVLETENLEIFGDQLGRQYPPSIVRLLLPGVWKEANQAGRREKLDG
jgi:hypothetical protein